MESQLISKLYQHFAQRQLDKSYRINDIRGWLRFEVQYCQFANGQNEAS